MQYISKGNLFKLLDLLKAEYIVFVPVKKGEQRFYKRYTKFSEDIVIGEVRATEPLKAFYARAREVVAEGFKAEIPSAGKKPLAIIGVKACDLRSFQIQDYVFQDHDYPDPFYIKARQDNLIISADCTCVLDTCFCLALGVKPHPAEDFDLNLSSVNGGFVVEVGSAKGQALLNKQAALFTEAAAKSIVDKDRERRQVTAEVEKNIRENALPHQELYQGVVAKKYAAKIWREEASTCVECGACNTICPTCHCFLLYDQKSAQAMARLRIWDSCMLKDFARVAGGLNPRPELWMRLRNRFEKKFDFFPRVAGVYACTGCGRCISACPAKIDIRKVLNKLVTSNQ